MTYQGFSQTDFARSAQTTLQEHVREVEEAMLRNFQFGALLDAAGRVNYKNGGRGFDWPVQYRLHDVEGNTGQTTRNFVQKNLWKRAELGYRGYQATDSMYYKEFLENTGEHAIVKIWDNFTERIMTSMKQKLATEYYVNGDESGNEESWQGLETLFKTDGTLDVVTGARNDTVQTDDYVAWGAGTYAGLEMALGNYSGENESGAIWPEGIADPEYDFWTPLNVIYTSTSFGGSADTFAAQGDEAMRFAIIHAQRNLQMDGQVTNIWLNRTLFMQLKNLFDAKEEIPISSEHSLRALGFTNVISFDGVEVSWEAGIPSRVGYGVNINHCELKSMDDSLLRSEGPVYDIHTQSYNAVVSTLSNMKFASPRNFFKLSASTDVDT
jgi:hypothetical protein